MSKVDIEIQGLTRRSDKRSMTRQFLSEAQFRLFMTLSSELSTAARKDSLFDYLFNLQSLPPYFSAFEIIQTALIDYKNAEFITDNELDLLAVAVTKLIIPE